MREKWVADGELVRDAVLKEILLHLLLLAREGDQAKVAALFTEGLHGDPSDVEAFRWCLMNWLVDKVVDGWPPLPDEVKAPLAASVEFQEPPPANTLAHTVVSNGETEGSISKNPRDETVTERVQILRAHQCHGRVVGQEGQSPAHGSSHGEAGGSGGGFAEKFGETSS